MQGFFLVFFSPWSLFQHFLILRGCTWRLTLAGIAPMTVRGFGETKIHYFIEVLQSADQGSVEILHHLLDNYQSFLCSPAGMRSLFELPTV